MREATAGCRGCDLWKPATQTVLRAPDDERKARMDEFVADLELARRIVR